MNSRQAYRAGLFAFNVYMAERFEADVARLT